MAEVYGIRNTSDKRTDVKLHIKIRCSNDAPQIPYDYAQGKNLGAKLTFEGDYC